jgi:hypothetical protein
MVHFPEYQRHFSFYTTSVSIASSMLNSESLIEGFLPVISRPERESEHLPLPSVVLKNT